MIKFAIIQYCIIQDLERHPFSLVNIPKEWMYISIPCETGWDACVSMVALKHSWENLNSPVASVAISKIVVARLLNMIAGLLCNQGRPISWKKGKWENVPVWLTPQMVKGLWAVIKKLFSISLLSISDPVVRVVKWLRNETTIYYPSWLLNSRNC